jgi:hypothetical protein
MRSQSSSQGCNYGKFCVLLLIAASLVLSSCVYSVSPLYTSKDVVYDKALEGVWEKKGDTSTWAFQKGEGTSYKLIVTEGENPSPFVAHLAQLGGHRFLDVCPDTSGLDNWKQAELYKSAMIPGHLFIKVLQLGSTLRMTLLDDEWMDGLLKKDPQALAHEEIERGKVVLTATTAALQTFLIQNWNTAAAWNSDSSELQRH